MSKFIVTGASGFLGMRLVEALLDQGETVIAIGNRTLELAGLVHPQLIYRRADITDKSQLLSVLENADVLFHCAAFSSDWGEENKFDLVNRQGSINIIECCEEIGITKLIYVSSASVYFNFCNQYDLKEYEVDAGSFVNAYARSKYQGEKAVLARKRSTQVIIIRPRGIVGKGDTSIAPRILNILRRGFFPLVNEGQALIDLTSVENVVNALLLAAYWKGTDEEIFNITNGEPMQVKQLLDVFVAASGLRVKFVSLPSSIAMAIANLSEWKARCFRSSQPGITRYGMGLVAVSQTLNIEKARTLLGYSPIKNLEQVVAGVAGDSP